MLFDVGKNSNKLFVIVPKNVERDVFLWTSEISTKIGSTATYINMNKWALKFEFWKSEKILPRDLSNDDILKILAIYLEY